MAICTSVREVSAVTHIVAKRAPAAVSMRRLLGAHGVRGSADVRTGPCMPRIVRSVTGTPVDRHPGPTPERSSPLVQHVVFFGFLSASGFVFGLLTMGSPRGLIELTMACLVVLVGVMLVVVLVRLPPESMVGKLLASLDDSPWLGPMIGSTGATLLGGGVGAGALIVGLPLPAVLGFFACGFLGGLGARLASMRRSIQ